MKSPYNIYQLSLKESDLHFLICAVMTFGVDTVLSYEDGDAKKQILRDCDVMLERLHRLKGE